MGVLCADYFSDLSFKDNFQHVYTCASTVSLPNVDMIPVLIQAFIAFLCFIA